MRKFIDIRNILYIAKKELKNYFDNPTAYVVSIVFLLLWEFLFFRSAFLVGEASLRILFYFLPWLLLILVPALTMGSISQEKSEGTLELLLTHPIKDWEMLAGKFLAAVLFALILFLFIYPLAAGFAPFGKIDWGVVFGQYLASIFLAAVLTALGIFISSLLASQISALLVSAGASLFLILAGLEVVTASLPFWLNSFLERLSVLSHFDSMSRGVIDLRDLWYFFSAITVFLSLAYLQLLKRRFGNRKSLYRNYQIGITLFIGIAILTNFVGARIPGRIDLTQDRLYTLTPTTKKILGELKDVVSITLFASSELPAQLQPMLRDTKDLLRDYQTLGKGDITVITKNPSGNPQAAEEANALGVRAVQFNVIGQEELQLKQGYLGLAISYAGRSEAIPFIQDTRDLEYQLTSFIKGLTATDKKKIGFLAGHGEKNLLGDYQTLSQELQKQFTTETISVDPDKKTGGADKNEKLIPEDVAVLVIAGPTQTIGEKTRSAITAHLAAGRTGLFLIDGVTVNTQTLSASPNQNSFSDFLKNYGVEVQSNLAYDLRANAPVTFGGGLVNFVVPYPFWPRTVANKTHPATARLESVLLRWSSSIVVDTAKLKTNNLETTNLLSTTKAGGKQSGNFSIDPQRKLPQENLGEQVMAVSIINQPNALPKTRMMVIGDSDFILDQFIRNSPENLAFGLEALSWLAQEESLAGIQIKQKVERKLLFENKTQIALVKYGNLLLAFFLPAGLGTFRLWRRRSMGKLNYYS